MDLTEHFIRTIPDSHEYQERLKLELSWFRGSAAEPYLLTVAQICRATVDIPRIIRGSAGSSLVVYALGISDIDPVHWNIEPERFFHPRRHSLPDIDLDFPDNRRDEVFERIYNLFPGRAARISNHSQFSDAGSIRQAVRFLGYRHHLPSKFLLSDVVPGLESRAVEIASELRHQVYNISLHCGGVVVFDHQVPPHLLTDSPRQIRLDKLETEHHQFMKIDILSNISLTQLHAISDAPFSSYSEKDELTSRLLSSGRSLGITQAESPAFQKLLRALRPNSLPDVVLAMALIRPASAWRAHRRDFLNQWHQNRRTSLMVYEDDATQVISRLTGLPGPESDEIRRAFINRHLEITKTLRDKLELTEEGNGIIQDIEAFRTFSMCKSHSVSYGRVVWALAYHKAHNPSAFWLSTINHAKSMWRDWVHIEEAKLSGLDIKPGKKPFILSGSTLYPSGYTPTLFLPDPLWELKTYGMWSGNTFPAGCGHSYDETRISFKGIIGTSRILKSKDGDATTFVTIGTSPGVYRDLILEGAIDTTRRNFIEGTGDSYVTNGSESVKVTHYELS